MLPALEDLTSTS